MFAVSRCEVEEGEDGKAVVDASTLFAFRKDVGDGVGRLEIRCDGDVLTIEGSGMKAVMVCHDDGSLDVPSPGGGAAFRLPVRKLTEGLKMLKHIVRTAMSKRWLRYPDGVLFKEAEDGLVMCATDGYRLCEYVMNTKDMPQLPDGKVFVPWCVADAIMKTVGKSRDGDAMVSHDGKTMEIGDRKRSIVFSIPNNVFPNYEWVVPRDRKSFAVIDPNDLLDAVRGNISDGPMESVRLELTKGKAIVSLEVNDVRVVREVCAKYEGPSIVTMYDRQRLAEMAKAMKRADRIRLFPGGNEREPLMVRAVFGDSRVTYLLMPLTTDP